jgi:hypothetical protein
MGFFSLPCKVCNSRVDCLTEENRCPGGYTSMFDDIKFLISTHFGWAFIMLGVFGVLVAGAIFVWDYFTTWSIKLLCSGVLLIIIGLAFSALTAIANETRKAVAREIDNR